MKFLSLVGQPVLGIDPGLNGSGWALMRGKRLLVNGVENFKEKDMPWEQRAERYAEKIKTIVIYHNPRLVAIEYPAFFDTAGGAMVAKKGDLLKLTSLVGLFWGVAMKYATVKLIPVNQWKGQLPKEVVKNRIIKLLGAKQCQNLKSHDYDATGLALFAQGITI